MAIIKFVSTLHPTSKHTLGNLKKCINYITNEEKTEKQMLVGTQNCVKNRVLQDMSDTMSAYGKLKLNNIHSRLGYHFCISFKKGEEINSNTAFNVVKEFCERHIPGYEAVYSVHIDKEHIHCHICFNAVSFLTGQKYRYEDGDWAKTIQPLLDEICRENNIKTLEEDCGIPIEEYENDRKMRKRKEADGSHNNRDYTLNDDIAGYSRNDMIKNDIDEAVLMSGNFEEFLSLMKKRGYQIKHGENIKYMAVKAPGDKQYRRTYRLDESGFYSEEKIRIRIAEKNKMAVKVPVNSEYRYILPERFRYVPKHFNKLNSFEKQYYAKMYRLGMAKNRYFISYQEVKKNMIEIDKIRDKLSILSNCAGIDELSDRLEDVRLKKDECINHINEVKQQQKKLESGCMNEEFLVKQNDYKTKLINLKKELREKKRYEKIMLSIYDDMNCDAEDLQDVYEEIIKEEKQEERNKNNESIRKTGKKRTI